MMPGHEPSVDLPVCGYVHRGDGPPEACPVWGRELFEPSSTVCPPPGLRWNKWRCLVCGYVHAGSQPPAECPVCGATADCFEPVAKRPRRWRPAGRFARSSSAPGSPESRPPSRCGLARGGDHRRLEGKPSALLPAQPDQVPGRGDRRTDLPIHPASWYEEQEIRLMLGTEVAAVRPAEHVVELPAGRRCRLTAAPGRRCPALLPPIAGGDREGVTSLRTVEDARRILAACKAGAKCVCIGGGLLGLETAGAGWQGADVTLLEGCGWLLPRQLPQRPREILGRYVAGTGIKLRTNAVTRESSATAGFRLGVLLQDGSLGAGRVGRHRHGRPVQRRPGPAGRAECEPRRRGLRPARRVAPGRFCSRRRGRAPRPGLRDCGAAWQFQGSIAGLNLAGGRVEFGGHLLPQ